MTITLKSFQVLSCISSLWPPTTKTKTFESFQNFSKFLEMSLSMILWTLCVKIKYFSTSACEQLSLCRLILQIVCVLQKFEKFATFLVMDKFHKTGTTFQFKHTITSRMYRISTHMHVSQICMTISSILSICM